MAQPPPTLEELVLTDLSLCSAIFGARFASQTRFCIANASHFELYLLFERFGKRLEKQKFKMRGVLNARYHCICNSHWQIPGT
jgi:hypothetical protein